jgi:SAM-dependent methyltransferase
VRNAAAWQPTKFVPGPRGHSASTDVAWLSPGSRLAAELQVRAYEPVIRAHARGRLLDLGCGLAPCHGIYRGLVASSVCVDWPGSAHARRHVDLFADLNRGLPLVSACADTVLLTDVLEHLAEPALLLGEVARLLRPGGHLVLAVPFLYWIHEPPHDYFRYTEFALRRLCAGAGLEVRSLEAYGGGPEVLLDVMAKLLAGSRTLLALHLAASRALLRLPFVRRLSRRSRAALPLGYCLVASPAATQGARP